MISKFWTNSLILTELEGSDEVVKCGQCLIGRQIFEYTEWRQSILSFDWKTNLFACVFQLK